MELVTMKCPNCGANVDLDKSQETVFCKYCGTKVIREQPSAQRISIENPIKIDGKIKVDNSEKFEIQLKQADICAKQILAKKTYLINDLYRVCDIYVELENMEGRDSRVYTHQLDFILEFCLEFFKKHKINWMANDYGTYIYIKVIRYNYVKGYTVSERCEELLTLAIESEPNKEIELKEKYQDKIDYIDNETKGRKMKLKKKNHKIWIIGFVILLIEAIFTILAIKLGW